MSTMNDRDMDAANHTNLGIYANLASVTRDTKGGILPVQPAVSQRLCST